MKEVKVSELQGAALDWAVMTAEGFKLYRVGYLGLTSTDDNEFIESPEQSSIPSWLSEETDNSVGAYWAHEESGLFFDATWPGYHAEHLSPMSPSEDWCFTGLLIHKYSMLLCPPEDEPNWEASVDGDCDMHYGVTPLIAVCRAIVAAKLGDVVSVPEELMEQPHGAA